MIAQIVKRDGRVVDFNEEKIADAVDPVNTNKDLNNNKMN